MGNEVREFPIQVELRRGSGNYVARLGIRDDGKYGGVQRDFLDGKRVKTRGTLEYGAGAVPASDLPVWVERGEALETAHCQTCKCRRPKDLIAVYGSGWAVVDSGLDTPELRRVLEAGDPGTVTLARCEAGHLIVNGETCGPCLEAERNAADLAAMPDEDPF